MKTRLPEASLRAARAFAAAIMLVSPAAHAEELERSGFVVGGWLGYGELNYATRYAQETRGTYAMGGKAGYALSPRVLAGLELNGWMLHMYNRRDPAQGESLSNASLFVNYFPLPTLPVYLAAGGGQTSYTNNTPAAYARDKGWHWFAGAGYEYPLSGSLFLAPQVRYARGNFSGGNFRAFELALGVNWYSGKAR